MKKVKPECKHFRKEIIYVDDGGMFLKQYCWCKKCGALKKERNKNWILPTERK